MPRKPTPSPDPIAERLLREGERPTGTEIEDVVALRAYVGLGRPIEGEPSDAPPERRDLRLFPDRSLQRWLDIPRHAVVDTQQLDEGSQLTRSVVWVRRDVMQEDVLGSDAIGEAIATLEARLPFSVWNLIPQTLLVSAGMLGMLPYENEEEG